jgi:hypothetical protein
MTFHALFQMHFFGAGEAYLAFPSFAFCFSEFGILYSL